jgi:hypothetical protein
LLYTDIADVQVGKQFLGHLITEAIPIVETQDIALYKYAIDGLCSKERIKEILGVVESRI